MPKADSASGQMTPETIPAGKDRRRRGKQANGVVLAVHVEGVFWSSRIEGQRAGDERRNEPEKEEKFHQHKRNDDRQVSDLARQLKHDGNSNGSGGGISLAGVLNAINGVAAREGRVLTNKPEVLDPALTRPSRVDMKVEFANATCDGATELFMYMYQSEDSVAPRLRDLAKKFSSHVPTGKFSPAQLQGYLLTRHIQTRRRRRLMGSRLG